MPSVRVHCAISKKRTGKDYKELHQWIDEKKGVNHRKENHHYSTQLKDHVSQNFGGAEAVSEWLFHIALNSLDTSIINDWKSLNNNRNLFKIGFSESGYIHYREEDA